MAFCQPQGNTRRFFYLFFEGELHKLGIKQLHVMETDLTLLLCMQQYCSKGAADQSLCVESTPHHALQTLLTSLCVCLVGEDLNVLLLKNLDWIWKGHLLVEDLCYWPADVPRVCIKLLMITRWWCMWRHCIIELVLTQWQLLMGGALCWGHCHLLLILELTIKLIC